MKVQKYEIARVIDKLKSIVQKNDQFPALGGILVKDGYLIASNSEITMKVKLEASEGSYFIIPMKAFDLIKNLPDGEIDISATDKNVVMIKIGAIKNKYQSYPPEEFNFDITEDPEADGVELNGKKIMEATAIEISQLVQFNLVRCLMVAFPEYSWGDWMDLHGAEAGVTRKEAVAATGTVSVTAAYGTVLAAGTVFAVPATDQMEAVEFQTLRTVTFAENETMDLAVEAVTPGVSGNVPANTITIMASPINGVTAITNSEKTSGGAEEENDEDYYERIHAEFQDSQFYVANDADYIKWAKEVPGIGDCIVEPAVEGPGTVGLILVDSNGQPASSTLVTAVYNHIVSPDDRSKRLLPTGSSKLIVKSATVKTVDFACTGLVLDGVGLDDVISTFKTEMMAVYSAAKETNILRYNSARTVLSTITGVSDFIDFTMDGKRENIHLSSSEYADTGNVTFTLEGAET